jgi:hypothetical protein
MLQRKKSRKGSRGRRKDRVISPLWSGPSPLLTWPKESLPFHSQSSANYFEYAGSTTSVHSTVPNSSAELTLRDWIGSRGGGTVEYDVTALSLDDPCCSAAPRIVQNGPPVDLYLLLDHLLSPGIQGFCRNRFLSTSKPSKPSNTDNTGKSNSKDFPACHYCVDLYGSYPYVLWYVPVWLADGTECCSVLNAQSYCSSSFIVPWTYYDHNSRIGLDSE